MFSQIKPENFVPQFVASGVFLVYDNSFYLFKRSSYKKFGANKWALCAGGVEEGESFEASAKRELYEETGIQLGLESFLDEKVFYHADGEESGTKWHVFLYHFSKPPVITLNDEHTEYKLVSKEESFLLDLMDGEKEVIESFFIKVT